MVKKYFKSMDFLSVLNHEVKWKCGKGLHTTSTTIYPFPPGPGDSAR